MNERFLILLNELGWVERIREPSDRYSRTVIDYVKAFDISYAGKIISVPIAVWFSSMDSDELPGQAYYYFVTEPIIIPNNANSSTSIKGIDRIICMLDQAGYLTAMKFVMFGNPISSYKQEARTILSNHNGITI